MTDQTNDIDTSLPFTDMIDLDENNHSPPIIVVGSSKPTKTSKKPTTSKKGDEEGHPLRPRSSYNFFFTMQRQAIIKQQQKQPLVVHKSTRNKHRIGKHANVGFANLAKIIGEQWRKADPAMKKEMKRRAKLDKERYERELMDWNAKKKGVAMIKKDTAASATVITPDNKVSTVIVNNDTNATFPPLPFQVQHFLPKAVSASTEDSPSLEFNSEFICPPCSDISTSAGDVSSTATSSVTSRSLMYLDDRVEPMVTGSMAANSNASNIGNINNPFVPEEPFNAGSFVQDQCQSFIMYDNQMDQRRTHREAPRRDFPSSRYGNGVYSQRRPIGMSYVQRMRMEMERQHEEYNGYNNYDRAEEEDDMDVLRGLYNNRSMITSPRNGFY
ncbi:predicted protein [Thalassiosira pseudonana CCMP1335]|uniref:HMG box domain-containing protein n=1 Tax=Thalassiosira pseudonana TaxID=35128 RepID=B8C0V2_THAPS|nr:predicted protein [Thalassiosira pseudonana CCMP1335]EED92667.1 predicted protein [Thalassiosira pseudonana CCMP1335]